tara:strand:+ start:56 stop:1021 length:966 start_codon:yes stop_codon:yes gene_type:complete
VVITKLFFLKSVALCLNMFVKLVMKSENHTIKLTYGDTKQHYPYVSMSKILIGDSIRDAIKKAPMSDADLGDLVGVSENTIRRWKLGTVTNIRKSNLTSLAKILNKEISFNEKTVELSDTTSIENTITLDTPTGDLELNIQVDTLLKQKDKHINLLEKTLKSAEARIKEQSDIISQLEENIHLLTKKLDTPNINLDHSRMQFIVDMQEHTFLNCTQLYADQYGADAFEVIKNYTWADVIHKDDQWRFPIIESYETDEAKELTRTWKLKEANGSSTFVETVSISLDKEKRFKKVDAKVSTKEMWVKSNEYYKSLSQTKEVVC